MSKLYCPDCKSKLFVNVFSIDSVSPFSQLAVHNPNAKHVTTGMIVCLNCVMKRAPQIKMYMTYEELEQMIAEQEKADDRHNDNSNEETGPTGPDLKIIH